MFLSGLLNCRLLYNINIYTASNDVKLQNIYTVKPPNTADLWTGEKAAVFRKWRYWESYITYKTLVWDLKMAGGIGRAAVFGGRRY